MAQTFLETGEEGFLVARLDINHAIGPEAGLGDGRSEEVLAGDAPQDFAARPGGDPSGKQRGGRAVDHPIAAASDLMQRAEREAASRQAPVDLFDTEGKCRATARRTAFEALNALSKLGDDGTGRRIHLLGNSFR